MIKCIIFDSDGTLVDSEPLGHKCMEQELARYGYHVTSAKMEQLYRGWKLHEILDDIAKSYETFNLPDNFIPDYRKALDRMFEKELKPMPRVKDVLNQLQLPICLASSGPISKIETALRVTGLKKFFEDRVFSAYEIGFWKPDPTLFLTAAEAMGCLPEECLVVEDSEVGVQAGVAANMNVVHYNPEGINIPFDVIQIEHMNDLIPVIDKF